MIKIKARIIQTTQWISFFFTVVLVSSILFGNYNISMAQDNTVVCSDIDQVLSLTASSDEHISSIDSLLIKTQYLEEMRRNGQLLSSDEFASRITSYYDTLVAVLAGLFIVFSLTTYFSIKQSFETKFEDKRREIEDKQKQIESQLSGNIREELKNMLRDSRQVRDDIVNAVTGDVEGHFATCEALDELSTFVESVEKKQKDLIAEVAELQEHTARMISIKGKANSSKAGKATKSLKDAKNEK